MPSKKISVNKALLLAKQAIANNDVETARKLYRSILDFKPEQKEASNGLINIDKYHNVTKKNSTIAENELNKVAKLYLAGKTDLAEKLCRQHLDQYVNSAELLNLLGAILFSQQKFSDAIDTYNSTLELFPQFTEGYINRANAKQSIGKSEEALTDYNKAIELNPNHAEALNNRGLLFQKLNLHEKAITDYKKAIAQRENFTEAYFNLGNTLMALEKFVEASTYFQDATKSDPKFVAAYSNYAYCLKQAGDLAGAIYQYTAAIKLDPNSSISYCGRGEIYCDEGDYRKSIFDFNKAISVDSRFARAHNGLGKALHHKGRNSEAIAHLGKAIEIEPNYAIAYNNLGAVLSETGDTEGALAALNKVIALSPNLPEPYNNLGNLLRKMGLYTEAIENFDRALELNKSYAEGFNNRGSSLQALGCLSDAIDSYRKAISLTEFYPMAYSNLLTTLNYSQDIDHEEPRAIAQEFGLKVTRNVKNAYSKYKKIGSDGKLKIGFVSADLRSHPVGYFLEAILPIFGSSSIDIIAYPTKPLFDELSTRLKPYFSDWTPIYGMDDESAAARIKKDNVQILIDLSGHTAGNRLSMFGYKPAPVQISWLGYFATTGVKEIDYLIGDPYMTPAELDHKFSEKIIRLEKTRWCFTPPHHKVAVSQTPALKSGSVTFGCFNNLTKINDSVLNTWSKILSLVPNSQLLLKNNQFRDSQNIAKVSKKLEELGTPKKRIMVEGPDSRETYLKSYNRVDIALDPYPFTGGATSVEGLWMGVPLITLSGDSMVARQGVSILMNVGLNDWIASNESEYIDKAIFFASNIGKLELLRQGLRRRALASPLFDANNFVETFESSLIKVWQKHNRRN